MTTFFVPGIAVTQGSGRATINSHTGRAVYVPDHRKELRLWRRSVALVAGQQRVMPLEGPVGVSLDFKLIRGKTVKRTYPTVKPDLDKLERAVLDALTGIAWLDDAQVVEVRKRKFYADGDGAGLIISIWEVTG